MTVIDDLNARLLVLEHFAANLERLSASGGGGPGGGPSPTPKNQTKDAKDGKDSPDAQKSNKDGKDSGDKSVMDGHRVASFEPTAEYVASLQRLVGQLQAENTALSAALSGSRSHHFIAAQHRPDLSLSALRSEPDLSAQDLADLAKAIKGLAADVRSLTAPSGKGEQ